MICTLVCYFLPTSAHYRHTHSQKKETNRANARKHKHTLNLTHTLTFSNGAIILNVFLFFFFFFSFFFPFPSTMQSIVSAVVYTSVCMCVNNNIFVLFFLSLHKFMYIVFIGKKKYTRPQWLTRPMPSCLCMMCACGCVRMYVWLSAVSVKTLLMIHSRRL